MEDIGKGQVLLVGAGCGPGLVTVKGLQAVRQAEVLLYDDLIDSGILSEAMPDCEKIYVGKRSGRHSAGQEDIQSLLVEKASAGKRVVRLKGGDSFVFGRGGEEILALQEAGIPYEVIPGVTSAVAVPGHVGIPVTHRGIAQSVTVVTGHSATEKEENYEALAKLEGTLVFLMGLRNVPQIAGKLMQNGKPGDTPAALVSRGFAAKERRITGTLADIGEKAALAETPAVLVVGQTADFHMEPTIRRPLDGVSVTVAGTDRFVRKLADLLEEYGAETERRPVLRICPVPGSVPQDLSGYGWVLFTSAQGVHCFFRELESRRRDRHSPEENLSRPDVAVCTEKKRNCQAERNGSGDLRSLAHLRFACIGEGTAAELQTYGFLADFEPSAYTARALGRELGQMLRGKAAAENAHPAETKILILRAENGSPDLTEELEAAGVFYEDVVVYRTETDPQVFARPLRGTDYFVFASGAGVRACFAGNTLPEGTVPVCIGPSTEKVFRELCPANCLTAAVHTAAGIVSRILEDIKMRV